MTRKTKVEIRCSIQSLSLRESLTQHEDAGGAGAGEEGGTVAHRLAGVGARSGVGQVGQGQAVFVRCPELPRQGGKDGSVNE